MEYNDVNRLHWRVIRAVYVDARGGAVIALRDGGGMKVDSPEEAEKELTRYEGRRRRARE